jgi:uncharacterized protein (TIGR02147 family)
VGAEDLSKSGVKKETKPTREKYLSVYGYTDYRKYLKDFYDFKKDGSHGYSFRAFSKAAGFSSPNILKLVMDGQRNIGADAMQKFIAGLCLPEQMAAYFRVLVKFNQAKDDTEKVELFEELRRLTPQAKRRQLNAESLHYVSHWLHPVIREMVSLDEFRDDPYWISRRINSEASVQEITSALQFLIKEGFIEKTPEGNFVARDNMVLSSDEVKSLVIRKYHRQMLDQAKDALENLPIDSREFGALTFVLPEGSLGELKYKIKQFRSELHTWAMQTVENGSGEIVVQVNIQMYPHTRKVSQ